MNTRDQIVQLFVVVTLAVVILCLVALSTYSVSAPATKLGCTQFHAEIQCFKPHAPVSYCHLYHQNWKNSLLSKKAWGASDANMNFAHRLMELQDVVYTRECINQQPVAVWTSGVCLSSAVKVLDVAYAVCMFGRVWEFVLSVLSMLHTLDEGFVVRLHVFVDGDMALLNLRFLLMSLLQRSEDGRQLLVDVLEYPIQLPSHLKGAQCPWQKAFIPQRVNASRLLVLDADLFFLRSVHAIFDWFENETSHDSRVVGSFSLETVSPAASMYTAMRHVPYVQPTGINSGVTIWDTRRALVEFRLVDKFLEMQERHQDGISAVLDQDVMNTVFEAHPDRLAVMPFRMNMHNENQAKRTTWLMHHCVGNGVLSRDTMCGHLFAYFQQRFRVLVSDYLDV